jgi:choline dehydrogenase-like flavoprotein
MGLGAGCLYNGLRTTASGAYLSKPLPNLTIRSDAPVAKVLLRGKRATGVQTISGHTFTANKEVILSAGALNSPQILMLSGIGPAAELNKHGIPIQHELDNVGKNLQDHCCATCTLILKPGTEGRQTFANDPAAQAEALEQYKKDKTGLLTSFYCSTPTGFFKNDAMLASEEFKALAPEMQEHIKKPTVPMYEIATVSLLSYVFVPVHAPRFLLWRVQVHIA